MSTLLIFWVLLPAPIKLALWAGLGIALAAVLWRMLPAGKAQKIAPAAFLAIYLAYPSAHAWVIGALVDYRAQKNAWMTAKCRETTGGLQLKGARPIPVEGFLIAVNYEKLINERFQRNIVPIGDGTHVSGNYRGHPIGDAIPGGTFSAKAHQLLTQKRFSYVEVELIPNGYKGEYSNTGHLNTTGWSGTRYRLYYLAPGDHPSCVNERGEGEISGRTVSGGRSEILRMQDKPEKPLCLALEITDKSTSRYRINADEPNEWFQWEATLRGVKVPAWTSIRGDRIQIMSDSGEHYRYFGFDYPDELTPEYRCNSPQHAADIVGTVLVPNTARAFYRGKEWYAGSAVQRFYEPETAIAAVEAGKTESGDRQCPEASRKAGNDGVINQLDDLSQPARSRSAVQSGVSGTQPATFFALDQDSSISKLHWSGMLNDSADGAKFLIRIFKDGGGAPGGLVYESEVVARARSAGQWGRGSHVFEARLGNQTFPAGSYWLSVLAPRGAQTEFFWTLEPAGRRPDCGSGGVTRAYDQGTWGANENAGVVLRNARGFSFRIESKPDTGRRRQVGTASPR